MPRAKCISNGSYSLTIGREYDIQIDGTYCYVSDDNGNRKHVYLNRFQILEQTEPFQLRVGQVVTIRSDLREEQEFRNGDWEAYSYHAGYAGRTATIVEVDTNDNSFKIDIDNEYAWWVEEMCEAVFIVQTTSDETFAVYDIVRIKKECGYKNKITYITKITTGNKIFTSLSNYDSFKSEDIVKVIEEEINSLVPVPVPEVIPYTQRTSETAPTVGSRVKIPTRKTLGSTLLGSSEIFNEIKKGTKYLELRRVAATFIEIKTSNFAKSDVEVIPTKFVQGVIENGHRIKDNNGKTHTYESYGAVPTSQTLIEDNNDYIEYIDSTGWYILQWKGLVTKPRGTVQYTEYFALTPEDYVAYKAEQEERMAYLKSLIEIEEVNKKNALISFQIAEYKQAKDGVVRAKELKERIERERIEREERERQLEEERKYGIWKHHKDIWN